MISVEHMTLEQLLAAIRTQPEAIEFNDVIAVIDSNYTFVPTGFENGKLNNQTGENAGSCRIFAFAKLHALSQLQTLHCFGTYYRDDVLLHPELDNHQNIRQFMQQGWSGIKFETQPLLLK